jgi:hypothetical protein
MKKDERGRSPEEIAELGDAIYERTIRPKVENSHHGNVVAIDVNSEEYEVADNVLLAARALRERVPDAEVWCVRVGHRSLYRILQRASGSLFRKTRLRSTATS